MASPMPVKRLPKVMGGRFGWANLGAGVRVPALGQRHEPLEKLGQPVGRHGFVPERRHCFFTQGKIFLGRPPLAPTCAHLCVREPRQIYLTTVENAHGGRLLPKSRDPSVELPMGTTEIGDWACHKAGPAWFSCCPNLSSGSARVTSLGEGVFAFDENLERVEMPRVQRLPADTSGSAGCCGHEQGGIFQILSQFQALGTGYFTDVHDGTGYF